MICKSAAFIASTVFVCGALLGTAARAAQDGDEGNDGKTQQTSRFEEPQVQGTQTAPPGCKTAGCKEGSLGASRRKSTLYINHLLGGQYGPPGVLYQVDLSYRNYFFPGTDNILLEESFASIGMTGVLTPGFAYYGPSLTVSPLAIFRVTVEFTHYIFGVGGKKYGLLDYNPENGPQELRSSLGQFGNYGYTFREDHGDELGKVEAKSWALFIRPTLLLQFGPIVLMDMANFMYFRPGDQGGLYYNDFADIILTPKSLCVLNETLLLWEIATLKKKSFALYAGLTNTMTFVLPNEKDPDMEKTYRWKAGPMLAWTITDMWGDSLFEEPTLLLQAHYVIKDPIAPDNKRIITAALALAFSTNWDRTR